MKRILSVLISSVMLVVTCLTTLPVSAKEKYTEYIVPFYSDQTKQKQVVGISNESMLKDGVILIPLETACEIAGASIADENDEAVIITRNYVSWCCEYKDEKNQYLLVDSNTGKGNFYKSALKCLTKSSWSGTSFKYSLDNEGIINLLVDNFHQTTVPYKFYDDELYVSFYEFLVMMGVDVDLIDHEAINEITEFYTYMAEEYSDDEKYKAVISEIDKLFSAGTGYEQFFYCYLGTPIDELYKAYYDSNLMCDLGEYYGDGSVEWANLINAVENYDGLTKTALAALNLNTDYEDVLINTVTYHGDSEDDNFSKTVDDSVDIIQRLLYVRDFGLSVEEIYRDDSVLETVWKMQEKADNIEPILSSVDDFDVDFSLSPDAISMVYSGLCGAMKNYAKYREMSNLFEGEQYLMKNTILSSDAMASNTADEARGMFISHILNPMGNVIEMHSNLRNEENSYFNLYHSAAKVQETMNASSPAAWAAVWGAISDAALSTGDDLIMGVIDYTFFGTMPVSSLVNSGILFCVDGLKNTAYGKKQSQIAELDDYVFIQEVAKDCFKEHSLTSENAYSSFLLGLKATMLAYETNYQDSSWDLNNKDSDNVKAYNDMKMMLNVALSNSINTDFYNASPNGCDDLTEMLGENTDISKLDTTPRLDITLEFGKETNEPTKSETINYEEIYYEYLINNYEIAELVDKDAYSHSSWNEGMLGLISATTYDFNNDSIIELLTVTSEESPEHSGFTALYLSLYQYDHENVVLLDKIGLNEYSAGGEGSDSMSLSISGNAIYQEMKTNGRYSSMGIGSSTHEYSVIGVSDYSFNKYSLFTDTVNIIDISQNSSLYHNGVYDNDLLYHDEEKCNQLKSEQWYYCDNEHGNYNIDNILNIVKNKYSDFGLKFSSLNIDKNNLNDCITISTSLEGAVPLCSLERKYPKLEIIDYTNLRDHISTQVIDYEKIYYSYIENELIPKYGLASLNQFEIDQNENNSMPNTSFGIVSADIDDYDDDNSKELIVLTLEPSEKEKFYCDINLYLYSIKDNKVKCTDSINFYGYLIHDIHVDDFFTLNKCNNTLLFTNNLCYFSGEGKANKIEIIKIDDNKFVSEIIEITSYYVDETLYVNGIKMCDNVEDNNFDETVQKIISQKLMENGFLFDNVEYKGWSIDVSVTNNIKIAKYSASFDSSSANWFSVITPNDFTNLRKYIQYSSYNNNQSTDKPVSSKDIYSWDEQMIENAINNYLSQNWNNEHQYYVFSNELLEDEDYWFALIRWNGAISPNVLTGSDCKIYKATGEVEISFISDTPNEFFNIHDYATNNNDQSRNSRIGKITTEKDPLNVRQSPSTESEKIGTVDKGSTITILSEVNGWYEIEFNGKSGYVSGEFVQIVE